MWKAIGELCAMEDCRSRRAKARIPAGLFGHFPGCRNPRSALQVASRRRSGARVAWRGGRRGENPFNGTQHGVAIYYRACATGSSATGTISGNDISLYQKGGITVNCPGAAASVSGNTVTGNGPVFYIAQNGIQIGFGASGQVTRNTVTGHSYTGTNNASSAGILVFGGCGSALTTGVQIVKNVVGDTTPTDGNDVGVWLANYDPTCSTAPSTTTNDKVINNTITNTEITNISGNGAPAGYQAGISDSGVNDKLINNDISGEGYPNPCKVLATGTELCAIDSSLGITAKVHANSFNP
jgi:hypothetical protein